MKIALTKERTRRCPTGLGWLLIVLLSSSAVLGFAVNLYPFLTPNAPPHTGLLVVEGWIHDEALAEAVRIYRAGTYSKIVCTGIPIETGSYLQPFNSYSEMTTARLIKLGMAPAEIITAIGPKTQKDRTYTAATALRETLATHHITETRIHLITTGPHGRRSRLLFQKALGKDYHIGITCLPDTGYDPARWYAYSQGVRKVIGESIAYTYAKFFFRP